MEEEEINLEEKVENNFIELPKGIVDKPLKNLNKSLFCVLELGYDNIDHIIKSLGSKYFNMDLYYGGEFGFGSGTDWSIYGETRINPETILLKDIQRAYSKCFGLPNFNKIKNEFPKLFTEENINEPLGPRNDYTGYFFSEIYKLKSKCEKKFKVNNRCSDLIWLSLSSPERELALFYASEGRLHVGSMTKHKRVILPFLENQAMLPFLELAKIGSKHNLNHLEQHYIVLKQINERLRNIPESYEEMRCRRNNQPDSSATLVTEPKIEQVVNEGLEID